jgi:hypothetical protein
MVRYTCTSLAAIVCLLVGAADRRGAGLLGRLFQDPVLHRHAGRHAGVQGPGAGAAAGPVGRAVSRRRSRSSARASSRTVSRRRLRYPTSLLIGAVLAWPGLCQRQARARAAGRTASRSSPTAFFVAKNGAVRAIIVYLHLSDRLVSRPAQRAGHHDRADRALRLRHHAHHHRPAHLCARRQREGGAKLSGIKTERLTF